MKHLSVPNTPLLDYTSILETVSDQLDDLNKNEISVVSWPAYHYKPDVKFAIAHSHNCLYLKFYVMESAVRAIYRKTNDPVYKDSCVEFFIAIDGDDKYYNFEFNCAGTCKAGYGIDRNAREVIPERVIQRIKTLPIIQSRHDSGTEISWNLTLKVPITVFCKHRLSTLKGLKSSMNFFKCGDDLPQPHYLSWKRVEADQPNFHIPESFGEIEFA